MQDDQQKTSQPVQRYVLRQESMDELLQEGLRQERTNTESTEQKRWIFSHIPHETQEVHDSSDQGSQSMVIIDQTERTQWTYKTHSTDDTFLENITRNKGKPHEQNQITLKLRKSKK
jgi:hypothetical protein